MAYIASLHLQSVQDLVQFHWEDTETGVPRGQEVTQSECDRAGSDGKVCVLSELSMF